MTRRWFGKTVAAIAAVFGIAPTVRKPVSHLGTVCLGVKSGEWAWVEIAPPQDGSKQHLFGTTAKAHWSLPEGAKVVVTNDGDGFYISMSDDPVQARFYVPAKVWITSTFTITSDILVKG